MQTGQPGGLEMKHLRTILTAVLFVVMGTVSAFADVVFVPKVIQHAKWYIVAALVIIIIAISFLRASIRRRREKNESEIEYERNEKKN